jgi:hypothetical protein
LTNTCRPDTILAGAGPSASFLPLEFVTFAEATEEERLAKSMSKHRRAMTPHPAKLAIGLGRYCTIETL